MTTDGSGTAVTKVLDPGQYHAAAGNRRSSAADVALNKHKGTVAMGEGQGASSASLNIDGFAGSFNNIASPFPTAVTATSVLPPPPLEPWSSRLSAPPTTLLPSAAALLRCARWTALWSANTPLILPAPSRSQVWIPDTSRSRSCGPPMAMLLKLPAKPS